jgi:hypothetical protein
MVAKQKLDRSPSGQCYLSHIAVRAILVMVLTLPLTVRADEYVTSTTSVAPQLLVGLEYLTPDKPDRNLYTTSLDLMLRVRKLEHSHFHVYVGITLTHSTGSITQLKISDAASTSTEVVVDSPGTGIGPEVLARTDLFRFKDVTLSVDGHAGILAYDRDFPAGGARYNFMWRIGPTMSYQIDKKQHVALSYTLAHISNGQGLNSHNPADNSHGFAVQFLRSW